MLDYNWFFTALAQCNAAIVGFLGGFTINKILNLEREYSELNNILHSTLIKINEQINKISIRAIDWYNERINEDIRKSQEYEDIVKKGSGEINYNDIFLRFKFSCYESIENTKHFITQDWGSLVDVEDRFSGLISANLGVISGSYHENLSKEREAIDLERINSDILGQEAMNVVFKIALFGKEFRTIIITLVALLLLFLFGVIYPLSFIPLQGLPELCSFLELPSTFFLILFSTRGLLLFISTIIFAFIFFIFIRKIMKMKFNNDYRDRLCEYGDQVSYSKHFHYFLSWDTLREAIKIKREKDMGKPECSS